MQLSGILILALAVASGFAVPLNKDQNEDRMKNLISAVSDFISAQGAKMKPVKIPNFHSDTSRIPIVHDLLSANVTLTDGLYFGYNWAVVENITTYPNQLSAQLNVRYPLIGVAGNYELEGKVLGHLLAQGKGDYIHEVFNMTASLGNVQLSETEKKALRVESLGTKVDLDDNKFIINGLNIKGLSVPTFEKIVDLVLHKAFDIGKRSWATEWEISTVRGLNQLIGDRTLEEVVEYLKEHKDADFSKAHMYPEQMMTLLRV